ncbi:MAG: hypothetical protein ABSG53_21465, partial [Thermoguttaceae bacterium]
MSIPSSKKRQRRHKRKEKQQKQQDIFLRRKQAFAQFPEVFFEPNDAPPRLVSSVREAVKILQAEHENLFAQPLAGIYRLMKRIGISRLLEQIMRASHVLGQLPAECDERHSVAWTKAAYEQANLLQVRLGEKVFELLPDTIVNAFFPVSSFEVGFGRPNRYAILIRFKSLSYQKTPHGRIYFSPQRETIEMDGKKGVLAYTSHAIEAIVNRTVTDWKNYAALGNALYSVYHRPHMRPWYAGANHLGFALFDRCAENPHIHPFVEEVAGAGPAGRNYGYRLGYCPSVFNNG